MGEDVGHYGGSYKVTFGLYKKYGEMRVMDTPICGKTSSRSLAFPPPLALPDSPLQRTASWASALEQP